MPYFHKELMSVKKLRSLLKFCFAGCISSLYSEKDYHLDSKEWKKALSLL